MTLKELMLGNFQSNQGTAVLQMGAQNAQKSAGKSEYAAFGDILGSRMSSADNQNRVKRNDSNVYAERKNTEQVSDKVDNKTKYMSFREAKKAYTSEPTVGHDAKLSENHDSKLDEVDVASKKEDTQNQRPENMLNVFAQVLGLDISNLQKLLNESGIASESFGNMQNIGENASKLSQLLGLNSEQEDTLVKMLQLTAEAMDSLTAVQTDDTVEGILPLEAKSSAYIRETGGTTKLSETAENQPTSPTAGKQETLQAASIFESLAEKLNLKIKVKLNELGNKLETDQSMVKAELKQLMQPLLEKAAVKVQETMQQPIQQIVETDNGEVVEQTVTTVEVNTEAASSEDDGARQEANAKDGKETVIQQPVTVMKETQPQAAFAVVQLDKVNGADAIEKAAVKAPLSAKEIISQVIEKAKVILTPDKSEMLMDLKPDSLGKISLKVVTESGIVMAKFIAENQQVKQVLEANMQLLKDSLEKQGMSVQGFSVSVRQDSNQSAERWAQPKNSRNHSISGTAYRAGIEGSLVEALEATSSSNPYTWGSSTINLKA